MASACDGVHPLGTRGAPCFDGGEGTSLRNLEMKEGRDPATGLSRTSSCPSISSRPVATLRHSASGGCLRHADQEVEYLVQQVRQLCHERKTIRQDLERLDQRCCTEAVELRARLLQAQQHFALAKQQRQRLRRELEEARAHGLSEGQALSREICFLQSHVESLQTGCSLMADHVLAMKDEARSLETRREELQHWQLQVQQEALEMAAGRASMEEELKGLRSRQQLCQQEISELQHQLQAAEGRCQKVKEETERETHRSLKRLQAKLKESMAKEEELRSRHEDLKAKRLELQKEETHWKERLLSQEEDFGKIRDTFGTETEDQSKLPLVFCEQIRTLLPDLSQVQRGIPVETHQRILEEQTEVYRDALAKLGHFQALVQPTAEAKEEDLQEISAAAQCAREAEEAAAQIQIQILELSQELELSTCKLQLLKDSLLAERRRKEEVSKSLRELDAPAAQLPSASACWALRSQIQVAEQRLQRRCAALQKLQRMARESTSFQCQDLKLMLQQLPATALPALAALPLPGSSSEDLRMRQEIAGLETQLLELRSATASAGSSLQLPERNEEAEAEASLRGSKGASYAVQQLIRCLSECLNPSLKEDFTALLQRRCAAEAEAREVTPQVSALQSEVQQVLAARRVARQEAAKDAARRHVETAVRPDETRLQALQKHCITSCANISELSARLSLGLGASDEGAVKELLWQEDLRLQLAGRLVELEEQRSAALEEVLAVREALAQRAVRTSLEVRQAAAEARRPLERSIAEAGEELQQLRQQLPSEVQRLEQRCAERLQEKAPPVAFPELRSRLAELSARHHALTRSAAETRSAEAEGSEQEPALMVELRQKQQQLLDEKRLKSEEVEKCRFSLWDVEQNITDVTEARSVQLRCAETRLQELIRQHSMKMADMKSEAQRELHAIRNSSRRLAKCVAEELEMQDLDEVLRVHGDLEMKSAELLQTASKQLSSLAAAGA